MMDLPEYDIEKVVLKDLPEDRLDELFSLWDVTFREEEPDDPIPPRDLRIQSTRNPDPRSDHHYWIVTKNDSIVGSSGMGYSNSKAPDYEQNKNNCWVGVTIHPDHRRKGIATQLVHSMVAVAKEQNKSIIQSGISHPVGIEFVKNKLKAKPAQEGGENRLYMDKVDWDMIQNWADNGKSNNSDVELREFEICPDDIIDSYMEVYTETMNQQPLGDMEWKYQGNAKSRREDEKRQQELGTQWFTLISQEADGSISGLTEMFYNPKMGHRLSQNLTGVKEEYRGKGLGKWLKAELLIRMRDRFPEVQYVSTGNADSNAPMLSINNRMGFVKKRSFQAYKFTCDELLEKLS